MEIIGKCIIVSGTVQGVGFRYSTNRIARSFGIKGFVKNQKDGSVLIHAEGSELQLKNFIKWCYEGPIGARVTDVSILSAETHSYKGFSINH